MPLEPRNPDLARSKMDFQKTFFDNLGKIRQGGRGRCGTRSRRFEDFQKLKDSIEEENLNRNLTCDLTKHQGGFYVQPIALAAALIVSKTRGQFEYIRLSMVERDDSLLVEPVKLPVLTGNEKRVDMLLAGNEKRVHMRKLLKCLPHLPKSSGHREIFQARREPPTDCP
eukprot:GHVO01018224.1.p1 GENE.GHVO01018224.1~~GHVO01018224.1.p1  ORF type:complete len:169 (-),score=13.43 GHVO01018224.1:33-539(-)